MKCEYTRKSDRTSLILKEIKRNELTKKDYLADKLGVCERTIVRDVRELIKKGNPIQIISGRGGGYSLKEEE